MDTRSLADDHAARQSHMESWYDVLIQREDRADILLEDYAPHAEFLRSLRGQVLDVGGGVGIAARFLAPSVRYVVVEPSSIWKSPDWADFGREFRLGGPQPEFIACGAEALPFPDRSFDVLLSFWSLNHVVDPGQCVAEMKRVLKVKGKARLVIDDMEPNWTDVIIDASQRLVARVTGSTSRSRVPRPMREILALKRRGIWRVEPDHLQIPESELLTWCAPEMRLVRRQWLNGSISYDLVRT